MRYNFRMKAADVRKLLLSVALLSPHAPLVAQTTMTAPVTLAAAPPQTVAPSNSDSSWRPTDTEVRRVQEATAAYFAARDKGQLEAAYEKFSPGQRATTPFAAWRQAVELFNARSGGVTARSLREVTWYKDLPGRPGVYAAVDFTSQAPNLTLHCGYVVWQEQADGSFLLIREEDNILEREMEAKLNPGDLERIRAEFKC